MNYAEIKYCDIANGSGTRTTLFVSGCTHHCAECFQPQTWNFDFGEPFTREVEDELIESMCPSHIRGLTLLGGEPMEPSNQRGLVGFLERVKDDISLRFRGSSNQRIIDMPATRAACEVVPWVDDPVYATHTM